MTQKQPKNPNVIQAKIARTEYDYQADVHILKCVDSQAHIFVVHISNTDHRQVKSNTKNVTLWCGPNYDCKYIAFGDYIVECIYQKDNTKLNAATQKHFDEFKRGAEKRLAVRERLDKIQQKVTLIRQINTKSDAIARHAKQVLIDFLAAQMTRLRQDLDKRR